MVHDTGPIDKHFFAIVTDMQNFTPLLEDAILKGTKMHTHFKTLLQSYALFWESIHKLADLGAVSQGCSKPLGACLSRLCTKMSTQELKLRQVCNHLMSSTLQPLQDELEDWKKQVNQLEKDHNKELKSVRNNYKRATYEWQRMNKKNSGGSDLKLDGIDFADPSRRGSMPGTNTLAKNRRGDPTGTADKKLLAAWQEYSKQKQSLQDRQREFLRRAVQMDKQRYSTLWHCMRPLMDSFVSSIQEMCHLEDNVNQLNNLMNSTLSTNGLDDPLVEQRLKELTVDINNDSCETNVRDSVISSSFGYDRLSLSSGSSGGGGGSITTGTLSGRCLSGTYAHPYSGLGPASRHSSTTSLTSYSSLVSSGGTDSRTPRDSNQPNISGNTESGDATCKDGTASIFFSSGRVPSLTSQDSGIASNKDHEYAVCGNIQLRNPPVEKIQLTRPTSIAPSSKVDDNSNENESEEDEEGSASDEEEEEESSSSDTANGILEITNSTELIGGTVRSLRGCSDAIQSLEAAVARHTSNSRVGASHRELGSLSLGHHGHTRPTFSASTFEPCQGSSEDQRTLPSKPNSKFSTETSPATASGVQLRNSCVMKPPPPVRRDSPSSHSINMNHHSPGFVRRGSCISPSSKSDTYSSTANMLFKQTLVSTLNKPTDSYASNNTTSSTFAPVEYACQSMGRFNNSAYTSQHFTRDLSDRHSVSFDKRSHNTLKHSSTLERTNNESSPSASKVNFLAELKIAQQTRHVTVTSPSLSSTNTSEHQHSPLLQHHHQVDELSSCLSTNNEENNHFLAALRKRAQQLKPALNKNDRSAPCIAPAEGL